MSNGCCGAAFKGRQCRFPIRGGPRLSVLENGFNFHDGPAFVAGITRTRPPAPISACELTSSSMGTTESSVSGVQSRVRSRSPGKICHRCATANPTQLIVAQTELGRGVLGVVDGASPLGVETDADIAWRKDLLRKLGYKL